MNTFERIRFALLLVALTSACSTGCSTPKMFSLDSTWPFGDDKPKPEMPNRLAGMWTDTVLHKAGEKPQRGFGGRLMFYGKDPEKPVLVDGELVVYAFDETGRELTDNKPTRRYVFPADQLALRQSESPLGPSYNFFLPWDDAGGPQTEVSIICRFQPKEGAVVISEQTKHLLPGALRPATADAGYTPPKLPEGVPSRPAFPPLSSQLSSGPAANGAQQASYQVAQMAAAPSTLPATTANLAAPASQMSTTSIPLPRDFQIPQGVAPAPIKKTAPAVGQYPSPSQPATAAPNIQPTASAANVTVPTAVSGKSVSGSPHTSRFASTYHPPARHVGPAVYNSTFASAANGQGVNQPLQVPPLHTVPPPTVATLTAPQQTQVPQSMQGQQTLAQLPTNGGQTAISPQNAPQMMQIPAGGTATVTYR